MLAVFLQLGKSFWLFCHIYFNCSLEMSENRKIKPSIGIIYSGDSASSNESKNLALFYAGLLATSGKILLQEFLCTIK